MQLDFTIRETVIKKALNVYQINLIDSNSQTYSQS